MIDFKLVKKKLHFVSLVMLHMMPGFYHVNGVFIFELYGIVIFLDF